MSADPVAYLLARVSTSKPPTGPRLDRPCPRAPDAVLALGTPSREERGVGRDVRCPRVDRGRLKNASDLVDPLLWRWDGYVDSCRARREERTSRPCCAWGRSRQ